MSAGALLQAAVAAHLRGLPALAEMRVFDAPPVRGGVPYALVEDPVLTDWSTKSWRGREARLTVTIADAGEQPVRLRRLAGLVEDGVPETDAVLGEGWRIVRCGFVRARLIRAGADRWTASSEFVVRMIREDG